MSLLDFWRSPKVVSDFVRRRFDDEKLAQVSSHNDDGLMLFMDPCNCLVAVASCDVLHELDSTHHHYRDAIFGDADFSRAEEGYWYLGTPLKRMLRGNRFVGDRIRRWRFAKVLRKETARRDRVAREWRENRCAIVASLAEMDEELTRREKARELSRR